jgi:hypothetical protein
MVTWLTRSLSFIVAGAVLAYAVTVHTRVIDLQTTGVILLLVGIFDLLLNIGLLLYERRPMHAVDRYRIERRPAPRAATRPYPELSDDDTYPTRPIRRDRPNWH